jgi:mannose-6-phosphate isomerase-like protein (cupin superfamily)
VAPTSLLPPIDLRTPAGATRLAPSFLRGIAEGLARSPLWHGLAAPTPEGRSAVRVVRTECYEAWVLGWLPSHRVEMHDHGSSDAAFTVVEGSLVEVTVGSDGRLDHVTLAPGDSRLVASGQRHDVLNLGDGPAVSIHVYSPALTSMTFYDPIDDDGGGRVEPVTDDGAVWPDLAAHRWLHPSRR